MKKKFVALLAAAALCLSMGALAGCSSGSSSASGSGSASASASAPASQTITDMVGRSVEVPTNPQKIIGVGSSSLRLISYMQATDLVVGVEQSEQTDAVSCAYRHVNHDAFAKLTVIGDGGSKGVTPNEEAIMGVAPQVIFASIDKDAADALQEKTKIPVVCLTLSDKMFDDLLYDNFTLMGKVLGKETRAAELVKYMKDMQADLQKRVAAAGKTATAYAAGISFRGGHGFAGTEAGFAPFVSAGVTNIADAAGTTGCFDIDLEAVSAAQPEYIFVESSNMGLVKDDVAANPAYFQNMKAVQEGNVYGLISFRFYATNIELALANCYQVAAVCYPDQFKDVDPAKKLDEITTFFLGAPLYNDLVAQGGTFGKIEL